MGLLQSNAVTLQDMAKRINPDGKIAAITEMLSQTNEILDDMTFKEANLPTAHRTTIRSGLPKSYWRLLNTGTPVSKSKTVQVDESVGMLEAWSEVDEELANLNSNVNAFRLSEAAAFIESMSQEMASTVFYGNSSVNPEQFNGFSVRYADKSADNAKNILDAGGTGSDNSSIWLVVWGDKTCHGIVPKGSQAGIEHKDLGVQTIETTNGIAGNRMRAYQDQFKFKCGLVLADWRYVVRICNIDISNLVSDSGAADLIELMIKSTHLVHNLNMGKACFYMNRTIFSFLDIQRYKTVAQAHITFETVDGKSIPTFRGIPIKKTDALLETEARVI